MSTPGPFKDTPWVCLACGASPATIAELRAMVERLMGKLDEWDPDVRANRAAARALLERTKP